MLHRFMDGGLSSELPQPTSYSGEVGKAGDEEPSGIVLSAL